MTDRAADRFADAPTVLEVQNLGVAVGPRRSRTQVVHDAGFRLRRGEILALVGESGSGKSLSMLALTGLLPAGSARITGGRAMFDGTDLTALDARGMRSIRGARISMIFQDPLTALDPLQTIGAQIVEALRIHDRSIGRAEATLRAVQSLEQVGIPDPAGAARRYPHEFSGGMRQRAMIAIAMVNDPEILIADEPTTALDVTIQAQILTLISQTRDRTGMAVVLITHDLGVVGQIADTVVTMYSGRTVENGPADRVLRGPAHHYTRGLLDSIPPVDRAIPRLRAIPGSPPQVGAPPAGCAFHPRCPRGAAETVCRTDLPERRAVGAGTVCCHFPLALDLVKEAPDGA